MFEFFEGGDLQRASTEKRIRTALVALKLHEAGRYKQLDVHIEREEKNSVFLIFECFSDAKDAFNAAKAIFDCNDQVLKCGRAESSWRITYEYSGMLEVKVKEDGMLKFAEGLEKQANSIHILNTSSNLEAPAPTPERKRACYVM